ncbi:MFS transporter [Nocardiopsis terrae]|uniref:EmrB/QacA subfamily drug resistance transporter n=1 Tax=Nocardiopsis terrae TaxID=372655 RepID=A0ABR9HD21_9ACTN|nr:MFS transporter [Nocardiopsis terrae]MBE1456931.1 EmrB/QacA subfamily drug resistance transporter [Nocardiopsis terrae]GHC89675.1 MFS transporter [Nocardiopsis terrae]
MNQASNPQTATVTARDPRRWVILGVMALAQLVVLLDNTVLNVAIPTLNEELDVSAAEIQWMINAYALVQSGLLLTAGSMADRYGRKRALMLGLALFGLASFVAAFSISSGQLIAARAAMGVGGALLMTTTLAVIVQVFDDEERPKAIGIWAAVGAFGFAAGPLIGGGLISVFWWGSIFLINVPVAIIGLLAVAKLVPESRNPDVGKADPVGAVLSIIAMFSIVYAIISGPEYGWTSVSVIGAASLGSLVLLAFVLWERHIPHPMIDMAFFRNRKFIGAVSGGLLIAFGMGGSLYLLTQHLQFVFEYSPLEAGLRIAPLALTVVALNLSGFGARVMAKIGTPLTVLSGMTLLSVGLFSIGYFGRDGYGGMVGGLVLIGMGIALAMPAMANAIMSAIPREQAGVGASIQGALTEFGYGLGVAILGAVLMSRFTGALPASIGAEDPESLPEALAAADSPTAVGQVADAFASGIHVSQFAGAIAVFAGGVLAAAFLYNARGKTTADTAVTSQ